MIDIKVDKFYRSLIVPLPLELVNRKFSKAHKFDKTTIKGLIDDYLEKNTESYEALAELMLELMNSEVTLRSPNKERLKEYEEKIEKLDTRFRYVNELIQTLGTKERNNLFRDYLDETAFKLLETREEVFAFLANKEEWNTNDALFLSYYNRYADFLGILAIAITKKKGLSTRFKGFLGVLAFAYQVVIYAYIRDKLNPAVMIRRYSELGLITSELRRKKSKLRKDLVASLSELPLPEVRHTELT